MSESRLICGDALAMLKGLDACSIDAVVTDPPYDLTSGGNRGFMGKAWDGTGIAFRADLWAEVLRIAKPGAHLLAFGGTRTSHRMVCAIEDAGWQIRDSILYWGYATGFPKSLNLGNGRGTALKPAFEPVCMARKPVVGTIAATLERYGTGALNIDACRISAVPNDPNARRNKDGEPGTVKSSYSGGLGNVGRAWDSGQGRWPANVILDEAAAEELDRQSGDCRSGGLVRHNRNGNETNGYDGGWETHTTIGFTDVGGASRFFFCAKPSAAERSQGLNGERNPHPTVKSVSLCRYLCRLVCAPGGTVLDPFCGSGSIGIAAKAEGLGYIGIDLEPEYIAIAERRIGAEPATLFHQLEVPA